MAFLILLAGTFVSEDLTCLSAGLLVRDGRISFVAAVAACAVGILAGDLALWSAGRFSRTSLGRSAAAARWLQRLPLQPMQEWLEQHATAAIIASRFMPGTRLPLYVATGLIGVPLHRFAACASGAVLLWTPGLVWAGASAGELAFTLLPSHGWLGWIVRSGVVLGMFLLIHRSLRGLASTRQRAARLARWSRWEFWPMWVFYAPVVAWVLFLSVRYRGIGTMTAANPGIPDGGVVGESKFDILSKLPPDCTVPAIRIAPGASDRAATVLEETRARGWAFPLVLKPDVGQRGAGVRVARNAGDIHAYCGAERTAILVQPYDPGPYEAGIFYYRFPGQPRGRILSITDKHFPVLVGDGRSTVEELIWAHSRYRLQAGTFLARHERALDRVLGRGERLQLAMAGNHAQGTLFRDGAHLWSAALERRIDEIARSYAGFFVGRFDVRYASREALQSGNGLAIVELNGATAESTNIYDPDRTLLSAYRQLFRQWSIVFAIGAANRSAGAIPTSLHRLVRLLHGYVTSTPAFALSD
jgi:membrane protein DedA with SNARE-associated domain